MKKLVALLTVVLLSSSLVQAEVQKTNTVNPKTPPKMTEQQRVNRQQAFEQRLNLTEEQIQKSKELRLESRKKMKPVIKKIKACEQEMQTVKASNLTEEEKTKKLNKLESDMKSLRKQAHDIKVENMKNFENILTKEQKKTLKEMRQKGKKNFNKQHKLNNQTKNKK